MQIADLLEFKNWLVIGDVLNQDKFAYKIVERLSQADYQVIKLNPRDKTGTIYKDLGAVAETVDVLDLVINPVQGLEVVRKAHAKGINKVLAQPGAESTELKSYCLQNGISYFEGCVLQELNKKGL